MNMQKKQIPNDADATEPSFFDMLGFLSNTSSIGLVITDVNGMIRSLNKTVQDMLGISIDACRNTNVRDLYANPDERQHLIEMLNVSGSVRNFEVQLKSGDGTLRTVLANVDSIALNGEPVLLTSLYDISQYVDQQKLHLTLDQGYQMLFSRAPVGITVTDSKGSLIISNNAIMELLGYTADELDELSVREFYLIPDDRKRLIELTGRLGAVRDFETVFRHKSGKSVAVLLNTDIIDFNGQPNLLLTSIRDISYLKRAELELEKERDFSNAILNISATLTVVLDSHGTITRFNHACEKASGYSAHEIIGTNLADTVFFEPGISHEQIKKLLSSEYPDAYETVLLSKSGSKKQISWTFAAILDRDGQVEFIIATGSDVTERRKAENDLKNANEELASWVKALEERTNEMVRMNEMGEQLQSCQTITEACAISVQYVRQIFPGSSGTLYLIKDSKNLAEVAGSWGEHSFSQQMFDPLNCWSVRRGRQHLVDAQHPGLLCGHIVGSEPGRYLCEPLSVNGLMIGILHLYQPIIPVSDGSSIGSSPDSDHKAQLVTMIAEHIALALSNLKLKESLRQQSIRDPLTGLYNRRYMEETLDRELSRASRENRSVGIMMLDIDHFKNFNDLEGHDAGDALLRELGIVLNQSMRGSDIVCRYGGEEFLVVLPGATKEQTRQRAEELRLSVREMLVYHLGKPLAKCTISIGIAAYPADEKTIERLLKAADHALYQAKDNGRDRVEPV